MSSVTSAGADVSDDGHERAIRILARSIVRELRSRGYGLRHIILLAGELIDLASELIRSNRIPRAGLASSIATDRSSSSRPYTSGASSGSEIEAWYGGRNATPRCSGVTRGLPCAPDAAKIAQASSPRLAYTVLCSCCRPTIAGGPGFGAPTPPR